MKADVIFVCVKGYSVDSITELIKRASHERTVVIPILNVYGTGPRIQRLVPGVTVLDGCIYIVGFVSGRGEITQMGKIFRLVYGAHRGTIVSRETLEAVQRDLQDNERKAAMLPPTPPVPAMRYFRLLFAICCVWFIERSFPFPYSKALRPGHRSPCLPALL